MKPTSPLVAPFSAPHLPALSASFVPANRPGAKTFVGGVEVDLETLREVAHERVIACSRVCAPHTKNAAKEVMRLAAAHLAFRGGPRPLYLGCLLTEAVTLLERHINLCQRGADFDAIYRLIQEAQWLESNLQQSNPRQSDLQCPSVPIIAPLNYDFGDLMDSATSALRERLLDFADLHTSHFYLRFCLEQKQECLCLATTIDFLREISEGELWLTKDELCVFSEDLVHKARRWQTAYSRFSFVAARDQTAEQMKMEARLWVEKHRIEIEAMCYCLDCLSLSSMA